MNFKIKVEDISISCGVLDITFLAGLHARQNFVPAYEYFETVEEVRR